MDAAQAALLASAIWFVAMLVTNHLARKHGIWDGAFNQFLPDVRKAMLEYRPNHKFEKEGV